MNKIVEIFKAWGIAFNPNNAESQLAAKRIEVCDSCQYKATIPFPMCTQCGCALKAKIYSPLRNPCPKGLWADADKEYFDMKAQYNKLKNNPNE
jgi:hypothetical protein